MKIELITYLFHQSLMKTILSIYLSLILNIDVLCQSKHLYLSIYFILFKSYVKYRYILITFLQNIVVLFKLHCNFATLPFRLLNIILKKTIVKLFFDKIDLFKDIIKMQIANWVLNQILNHNDLADLVLSQKQSKKVCNKMNEVF